MDATVRFLLEQIGRLGLRVASVAWHVEAVGDEAGEWPIVRGEDSNEMAGKVGEGNGWGDRGP